MLDAYSQLLLNTPVELLKALSFVKQHKHCLHFSSSTPKTSFQGHTPNLFAKFYTDPGDSEK